MPLFNAVSTVLDSGIYVLVDHSLSTQTNPFTRTQDFFYIIHMAVLAGDLRQTAFLFLFCLNKRLLTSFSKQSNQPKNFSSKFVTKFVCKDFDNN
jgi:hypothetical protein